MTNIEAKEKAVEILNEIEGILGNSIPTHDDPYFPETIKLAILQVKSNISLLKEVRYRKKLQDYELILSELEKM